MAARRKRAKRKQRTDDDEIETAERTLADELDEDPFDGIPPETSDLLSPPAERIERLERKGVDVTPDKVRVIKRINGKWVRKSGAYPPTLTVAQLERLFGPGVYGLEVVNSVGQYLWRNTATVGDVDEMAELEAIAGRQRESAGPGVVNVGANSELGAVLGAINQMSRTMERMMDRMSVGAAPVDPLRDSIAGMAKMMQLSMMAQTQAQALGQQSPAKGSAADEAVVHLLGELIKRPQPTPIQADLELLRLGLGLGAQLAGRPSSEGGEDPNKLPAWAQILPDVVDSIGVPTIMTLAQALLPADKARAVADVIRAHAEGGGGDDDDAERSEVRAKPPIDVPGHAA